MTAERHLTWGRVLSAVIDSHVHLMYPVEEQLRLLDEAGVGRAVLFPTLVHPEGASTPDEFKTEMAVLNRILRGEINPVEARIRSISELAEVVEKHGERFIGFASVPTGQDYDFTSAWIDKYVVGNNLSGIGEVTFGAGEADKTESIFRALSDYSGRYPLWIHTFNPVTLEDIRTITGYSDKYPAVRVILGHGGGSYWLETIDLISDRGSIYFDTSASFSTLPLKFAAQEFPERILFSSDMPYGDPVLARGMIEHVIKDSGVRSMILGENISRLLEQ